MNQITVLSQETRDKERRDLPDPYHGQRRRDCIGSGTNCVFASCDK